MCWTLRKEDERRLLVAEMAWLRRIRGRSRRERRTWSGRNGGREDSKKKTYMAWTRGKDGRKKTTTCSTAWACERRKKQRKTKEEMDGQCYALDESHIQISTDHGETKNREVWRTIIRALSSAS